MAASSLVVTWNGAGQTTGTKLFRNGTVNFSGVSSYNTGGEQWISVGAELTDLNHGFTTVEAVIFGEWGIYFFVADITNTKVIAYQLEKSGEWNRQAHRHSIATHTHAFTGDGHVHAIPNHAHSIVVAASTWGTGVPASETIIVTSTDGGGGDVVSTAAAGTTGAGGTAYTGPSGVQNFGVGRYSWAGQTTNLSNQVIATADLTEITAVPVTVIGT